MLARLVEELEADEDRSVVPVRVFWVPGGLPTRSKVVALLSGRDTYRPPEILQKRILKKDPSRARVVAGEPAKVSELRQQWNDTTVAENPREFARFRYPPRDPGDRTRRAAPAGPGVQVAAADQARDCWRRRGFREGLESDSGRDRRKGQARCSTNFPPGGVGSQST